MRVFSWILAILLLTGCSGAIQDSPNESALPEPEPSSTSIPPLLAGPPEAPEEEAVSADWSDYFDGMNGAAVIYAPDGGRFWIYNQELANTRRSPCSTFKIISSLIGLESHVIVPDDSVKPWSGEPYWNEDWNRDIDFADAFRTSCVWYFRSVADELGESRIQAALDELQYGNCDCSDWEGRLNTNNNNRALTGFWLESSLKISPKEQAEVMSRIFGEQSKYSEPTLDQLKRVMMCSNPAEAGLVIYGKTGMGKAGGVVVDAWFTGFADIDQEQRVYFCVYLGESLGKEVSSARAKEIAFQLISEYASNTAL